MQAWLESLQQWMLHAGPWAYVIVAASAAIEYILPPLPGDALTLFGLFLASSAGYSKTGMYLAVCAGAVLGSLVPYAFGQWLGNHRQRWPNFMQTPASERAMHAIDQQFARWGAVYLIANRFIPAFRAFFFVAAGLARLSLWRVAFYGLLSAAAWNALLLAAAVFMAQRWEDLLAWLQRYTLMASLALLLLVAALIVYRYRRARR